MSFRQYTGVKKAFKHYWYVYGGTCAIVASPYFGAALLLTLITFYCSEYSPSPSYEMALAILPNLLGFTLGGYIVMFSFGDSNFLSVIAGEVESEKARSSPLIGYAARYMHFLVVQTVALILAVLMNAAYKEIEISNLSDGFHNLYNMLSFLEYFLLFYALFLALATTVGIYKTALRFDKFITIRKKKLLEQSQRPPE